MKKIIISFSLIVFVSSSVSAAEISVAVASNFKYTLQQLAADFKLKTSHELIISSASSGKLFVQIKHGAPYDVYLSADEQRVDLLISQGLANSNSAYVYALGRLIFVSNSSVTDDCKSVLSSNRIRHLAIANPAIAPYGFAAKQVLQNIKLWPQLQSRLVMAENVSQTFQFVSTKAADAGFVSRSLLKMAKKKMPDKIEYACVWNVPVDLHSPIKQKMVVLDKAKNKLAVYAFSRFMQSQSAQEIITNAGYDVQ